MTKENYGVAYFLLLNLVYLPRYHLFALVSFAMECSRLKTEDGNTQKLILDRMGLNCSDIVRVLISAVQEQNTLIESLQSENAELVENQAKVIEAMEKAGIQQKD